MRAKKTKPQSRTDRDARTTDGSEKIPIDVAGDQPPATSAQSSIGCDAGAANPQDPSIKQPVQPGHLSTRAENVLKILAADLTHEKPPRGRWVPSDLLLQRLTYTHLSTARNCGPRTTTEIIEWARARGVIIRRPVHAGKSLSAMWKETTAKLSAGEISNEEIADALEKSARRGNTRIPVAFQRMLLRLVESSNR